MYPALRDNLTADQSAATHLLDQACRRLACLAQHVPPGQHHAFHRTISIIHDICDALVECEAAAVDPAVLTHMLAQARQIHALSPFIRRLQEWPRGYPGDFETIEWLCRGESRADGTLARALEGYALTSSIAQQHRNKVVFQASCLLQAIADHEPCRILSLACGSNPDVRSILPHIRRNTRLVLCDSDRDALAYSAQQLEPIADRVTFVHGMVPRILRRLRDRGPYHAIVAGGLFDYLPDRVIAHTLEFAWRSLLAPGGVIVFTNIATGNPFRVWLEHLAEWRLIERSEADLDRICRDAGIRTRLSLQRESSSLAILASVRKPCSSLEALPHVPVSGD